MGTYENICHDGGKSLKKLVGIIGGTGKIGQKVCEKLVPQYDVRLGQRHMMQSDSVASIYKFVDLQQPSSLYDFYEKCDLIVNCAGPSYIYSNIAMKIANNMKIPYVDVFGSRFYSTKAVSISTINVLSAGCYPGFTGILPVGFLEGKMDEVITLKEIVGGRELGSLVACQDVIMSAIKNYGKVNMYMDTGQMTYNNLLEKDIKGGFPENVSLRLYFTEEFDMLCKKYKIPQAYFYNAVVDEEIDKALSMACVKLSHECDESVLVLEAKKISALQENLVRERGNWYGMHLEADGIYNGKKKTISVYVKVFNTSLLSAGIAVEVIKSILSEHHNSGVYYPFEILNNQKTIRKLIEEGVIAINGFSESYEDE